MLRTSNYLLCMVSLKVASHLTFVFASAFQKDVKFVSTSLKFESSIRTLPLVEKDPIFENARADVTRECRFNFSFSNQLSGH